MEQKPNREWGSSAKTIIEMGKKLEQMKANHTSADLSKIVNIDYGINGSSINKIIKVSKHPVLSNPEYADKLPDSWAKLYEIQFLPDEVLLEKIKSGEIKKASKYTVWEWRGIKAKRSEDNLNRNRIHSPSNVSLVAYVSAGMQREPEFDGDIEAVAVALGIGRATYRQIRQIILLSRHPNLSDKDGELVQSLIDKINKTRNIQKYYLKARPLIEQVWGSGKLKKDSKTSQRRVDGYLDSVFLLGISAQKLSDMERPYMSIEDTDKAITELAEAGTIIRKVAEALRRSKND